MSVASIATGFWRSLMCALFSTQPPSEFLLGAPPKAGPVPPPPLIDRPHARATATPLAAAPIPLPAEHTSVRAPSHGAPAARTNFMLSARLSSASSLNPPKHRTGKAMPAAAVTTKRHPSSKAIPKKVVTQPKASPRARHVWLHGAAAAAPSRGAEIVHLPIARPAAPAPGGSRLAPVTGNVKAKRAA